MTELQLIKMIYMMRFVILALAAITLIAVLDRIVILVRFFRHNVRRKGSEGISAGRQTA